MTAIALCWWHLVGLVVSVGGYSGDGSGDAGGGVRCSYRELESEHGHDAVLAEPELLIEVLKG